MIGSSVHSTSTAVSLVYDGVEEAMPWQLLMDHLAQSMRAFDATLHIFNPRQGESGSYVVTSDRSTYNRPDWMRMALALAHELFEHCTEPRRVEELMSREQFHRTDIYRQVLAPNQLHYVLAQEVYRDPDICMRLAVDRRTDQGAFDDADKKTLMELSPHLVRAMRLRLRQQEQEGRIQLFEESLANMGIGVISLNARGEMLDANPRARQLLQDHPLLQLRNRRLCLDGCSGHRFKDLLDAALSRNRGQSDDAIPSNIRIENTDGDNDLQLVIKPLYQRTVGAITGIAAQVFINEVGAPRREFDPARLQTMFGFTVREARLAVLVAEGCSLNEASERLSVTINTVKTHLRGIYDKLGVRRQARVATILNSAMTAMM